MAGKTPAGVVITGGGAETVEAVNCCKRTLQLPTRLGMPLGLSGLIDEISSPAFSAATGLIVHAHNSPEIPPRSNFKLPSFFKKLPLQDLINKVASWFKSLLP
jgi:cell division protein FtsA